MSQYKYTITDEKGDYITFVGKSADGLIRSVQRYRDAHGIEITPDQTALEISNANGYEYIDGVYAKVITKKNTKSPVTFAAIKSACNAMIQNISNNIVDQKEMSRRWTICKACNEKTTVSDCVSCSGTGRFSNWINSIKSASKTNFQIDQESALTYCGVCNCSHSLMIPTKIENQKHETDEENQSRPDQCWMKKDGINYKP